MEIIQIVQVKKLSQQKIAIRFGCFQSAVSKIVNTKETVLREAKENMVSTRKRKRRGKAEDVKAALYKWFVDARARDAPVTSAVLEEKANHLAALLGNQDFKAANGWVCRWKSCNRIKFKKARGEKKDADINCIIIMKFILQ